MMNANLLLFGLRCWCTTTMSCKSRMVPRTDREERAECVLWLKISFASERLTVPGNPTAPRAVSRIGSFPPWCTGFCASLRHGSARHSQVPFWGTPFRRHDTKGRSLPLVYRRGVAAYSYGIGDADHLWPVLHEHGQPRAPDVFPARNSLIFQELKSSESEPLWMPYSDSSRRASAPTEVGLGEGVGTG